MTIEATGSKRITSANVVFCVDATGSMEFAITAVKNAIVRVAEIYMASRIHISVGLVQFRDIVFAGRDDCGYPTLEMASFSDGSSFTANTSEFSSSVGSLVAAGGGPTPESSFDAIAHAASHSNWSPGATRVIVHITDAEPRIPDDSMNDVDDLRSILTKSGIDQLFIVAPEETHGSYEGIEMAQGQEDQYLCPVYCSLVQGDVDSLVEGLSLIAQTSSDSILDDYDPTPFVSGSISPFDDDDDDDDEIEEGGNDGDASDSDSTDDPDEDYSDDGLFDD